MRLEWDELERTILNVFSARGYRGVGGCQLMLVAGRVASFVWVGMMDRNPDSKAGPQEQILRQKSQIT